MVPKCFASQDIFLSLILQLITSESSYLPCGVKLVILLYITLQTCKGQRGKGFVGASYLFIYLLVWLSQDGRD